MTQVKLGTVLKRLVGIITALVVSTSALPVKTIQKLNVILIVNVALPVLLSLQIFRELNVKIVLPMKLMEDTNNDGNVKIAVNTMKDQTQGAFVKLVKKSTTIVTFVTIAESLKP